MLNRIKFALLILIGSVLVFLLAEQKYTPGILPETVLYAQLGFEGDILAFNVMISLGVIMLVFGLVQFMLRRTNPRGFAYLNRIMLRLWISVCVAAFLLGPGVKDRIAKWQFNSYALKAIFQTNPLILLPDLLSLFTALLVLLWFSISAAAVGAVCLQRLDRQSTSAVMRLLTAFLIGQGLLAIVFLFLAIFSAFSAQLVIVILAIGTAIGGSSLFNLLKAIRAEFKEGWFVLSSQPRLFRRIAYLLIVLGGVLILNSWVRLGTDASTAYLADAKLMALNGEIRMVNQPYFLMTGFHSEMNFAALMLFSERAARLFTWLVSIGIGIAVLYLGREFEMPPPARLLLVLLTFSSTAMLDLVGEGKTDPLGICLLLVMFYWLLNHERGSLPIAGTLAGFALLLKPLYVYPIGVLCLSTLLWYSKTNKLNLKSVFRFFVWFAVPIIVLMSIHLLRNILVLGEPFAPFIYLADSDHAVTVGGTINNWGYPDPPAQIRLTYPFYVTYKTSSQGNGVLSPLWLAFVPLTVIPFKQAGSLTKHFTITAIISIIVWIVFSPTLVEIRYIYPLWILVFFPIALAAAQIMQGRLLNKFVTRATMIVLVFCIIRPFYGIAVGTDEPTNAGSPVCSTIEECEIVRAVNETAEPGEQVLFLSSYPYYLRPDLLSCIAFEDDYDSLRQSSAESQDAFWMDVYRRNFTTIAIETRWYLDHAQLDLSLDTSSTPPWMTLHPIYRGEHTVVYQVIVESPPVPVEWTCDEHAR